jgi:hypothetical protein
VLTDDTSPSRAFFDLWKRPSRSDMQGLE